jgi:hypothetical protein
MPGQAQRHARPIRICMTATTCLAGTTRVSASITSTMSSLN